MASCPQMAKTQHSCSCIDHFVFPYILPCQLVKTTDNLPANKGCPAVSDCVFEAGGEHQASSNRAMESDKFECSETISHSQI